MNAQKPDRHELQANGKHPAPCAKFCEATAFTIELRRAQAKIERLKEEITGLHEDAAGTSPVEPSQAVELSQQEAEALAHRRASKYAHRSDPSYVAYTFLPHTLMDFVHDVTAAINAKGTP